MTKEGFCDLVCQWGPRKNQRHIQQKQIVLSRSSCVRLLVTPWTIAHQAPWSMVFTRQEYWSGLPCTPPGDLPKLEGDFNERTVAYQSRDP